MSLMPREIIASISRSTSYLVAGAWLLTLYLFSGWMMVGSLSSIQMRDDLKNLPKGESATFTEVRLYWEEYRAQRDFLFHQTSGLVADAEELWSKYETAEQEFEDALFYLETIVDDLELDNVAPDDYADLDVLLQNIANKCEKSTGDDLAELCEVYDVTSDLNDKAELAYLKAEDAENDLDGVFDSTNSGDRNHPDYMKKLNQLRKDTKFFDLFPTVEFMDTLGHNFSMREPRELLVLQLTMVMGMLGSVVTMTWSFIRGNITARRFVLLPFVGSVSAVIIFVFLKAGQLTISSSGGTSALSPFFLSFVGIISGLLSERAYERMEIVGTNFFSSNDQLRWGVSLDEAIESAGVTTSDLAAFLDSEEDVVKSIISEKSAATLPQQQLIAACLRRNIRELFTDVPPGHIKVNPDDLLERVSVPSLIGKDVGECEQILTSVGLTLGETLEAQNNDVADGKVVNQTPDADTQIFRNASVDVTISMGPGE